MAEYIDRESVIQTVQAHRGSITEQIKALAHLPIADVRENKRGKWIKISPAGIYECSECGQNVMTNDIDCYKWCHGCGAKMEKQHE